MDGRIVGFVAAVAALTAFTPLHAREPRVTWLAGIRTGGGGMANLFLTDHNQIGLKFNPGGQADWVITYNATCSVKALNAGQMATVGLQVLVNGRIDRVEPKGEVELCSSLPDGSPVPLPVIRREFLHLEARDLNKDQRIILQGDPHGVDQWTYGSSLLTVSPL